METSGVLFCISCLETRLWYANGEIEKEFESFYRVFSLWQKKGEENDRNLENKIPETNFRIKGKNFGSEKENSNSATFFPPRVLTTTKLFFPTFKLRTLFPSL